MGQEVQEKITLPRLPLAVYRELAAHLHQLSGVEATLISQDNRPFDYLESQVAGVIITYNPKVLTSRHTQQQVAEILHYYSDRYCGGKMEKSSLE
ncbi:MAG: hypothetical protein HC916_08470 [Coleofasciculaceae cyanobacterium SM2_1_6]|nr:hypothetical protein [Coleofasciculaceae cyanobacterium SM2_1_6]